MLREKREKKRYIYMETDLSFLYFRDSVATLDRGLPVFVFRSLEPPKQYGFLFFVRILKKIYIHIPSTSSNAKVKLTIR